MTKNIELSDDVLIQCPIEGFAYIRVINCLRCDYYKGIAHATINGEQIVGDNPDAYQVICNKPITRRLHKVMK